MLSYKDDSLLFVAFDLFVFVVDVEDEVLM